MRCGGIGVEQREVHCVPRVPVSAGGALMCGGPLQWWCVVINAVQAHRSQFTGAQPRQVSGHRGHVRERDVMEIDAALCEPVGGCNTVTRQEGGV